MNLRKIFIGATLSFALAAGPAVGAFAAEDPANTGTCEVPPAAGIQELTASDFEGASEEQLNELGFTWGDAQGGFTPVSWLTSGASQGCGSGASAFACPTTLTVPSQTSCSRIWSGYVVGYPTDRYSAVTAHLQVPGVTHTCTNSSYAAWVGLGGIHSASLIQAGVFYDLADTQPRLFYEYMNGTFDSHLVSPTSPSVAAGDDIQVTVTWNPSLLSPIFTFTNFSQQNATHSYLALTASASFYDGSSADWIDERLSYSGVQSRLAKYTLANWSGAKVMIIGSGSYVDLTSQEQVPKAMVDFFDQLLSFPKYGASSSSTFTDYYYTCGN